MNAVHNDSLQALLSFCQHYPSTIENLVKFLKVCSNDSSESEDLFSDVWQDEHRDIEKHVLVIIVVFYVLMITCGILENLIVVLVILRNKLFQSPRNMLILNLAISDLILCSVTQPFNLIRFLTSHKNWAYGSFTCKFSAIFSGTNIFVSTISITVIAIDRFQLIIHPTKNNLQQLATFRALIVMWIISIFLASPMIFFTKNESFNQPNSKVIVTRCAEYDPDLSMRKIKLAYSTMSFVIQYISPLLIVITVYTRIFFKIKKRMVNKSKKEGSCFISKEETCQEGDTSTRMLMNVKKRKQVLEKKRQKRTNILLFCIGLIFALSWLPINIMNLIMDIILAIPSYRESTSFKSLSWRNVKTIQAICLLIVMCSACTNPLLYSWLNDNFKEKIKNLICCSLPNEYNSKSLNLKDKNNNHFKRSLSPKVQNETLRSEVVE